MCANIMNKITPGVKPGANHRQLGVFAAGWEQIFYGEFDGRRKKRVLVKIIGE
jgi:hypothetical protein